MFSAVTETYNINPSTIKPNINPATHETASNRFLVFTGTERPYSAQVGDKVKIRAFENLTETTVSTDVTITNRRQNISNTWLTGVTELDGQAYRVNISLSFKSPFLDTAVFSMI